MNDTVKKKLEEQKKQAEEHQDNLKQADLAKKLQEEHRLTGVSLSEDLEIKPADSEDPTWKMIFARYKQRFQKNDEKDEEQDKRQTLLFPSRDAAVKFFKELANEGVPFLGTFVVNGQKQDDHLFSCGSGELFEGSYTQIHEQLKRALQVEQDKENIAKLMSGLELIASKIPNANVSISMRSQLREAKNSENDNEPSKESTTAPTPFSRTPKPY